MITNIYIYIQGINPRIGNLLAADSWDDPWLAPIGDLKNDMVRTDNDQL